MALVLLVSGMMMAGCRPDPDRQAAEHPTFKTPPAVAAGPVQSASASGGQTAVGSNGNTHF